MIKELIESIKQSGLGEIFWILVGILLGKGLDAIHEIWKEKKRRKANTRKKSKVDKNFKNNNSIIGLTHAYPYYKDKNIKLYKSDIELFLDCPSSIKSEILKMNPQFAFREDKSFDKTSSFSDLAKITEIENLVELINDNKEIVAKKILSKLEKNEEIFNGMKFGVYNISTTRVDEDEDAEINIKFFETDYYTHMVFRSIYKYLIKNNHPIKNVAKLNELSKYKPFTTSFGINTYVIIDNDDLDKRNIVISKRSKYTGIDVGKSKWHVSMNEGLTITDLEDKNISFNTCITRGLNEELGIRNKKSEIKKMKCMDVFLEKNSFELGITSFVEVETSFEDLNIDYNCAKDSELETDEIMPIKFNKKEIKKFIDNNREEFTEAGLYTLEMIMGRYDVI